MAGQWLSQSIPRSGSGMTKIVNNRAIRSDTSHQSGHPNKSLEVLSLFVLSSESLLARPFFPIDFDLHLSLHLPLTTVVSLQWILQIAPMRPPQLFLRPNYVSPQLPYPMVIVSQNGIPLSFPFISFALPSLSCYGSLFYRSLFILQIFELTT